MAKAASRITQETVMTSRTTPICTPDWMPVAEIAARMGVSVCTVHDHIRNKTLGCRITRFGRQWRVNRADFEQRYGDNGSRVIHA